MSELSVAAAAREHPQRTAFVLPDRRVTYAEAADRALRFARVLGVGEGNRVATWSTNREAHLWTILACLELGATIVPVHPRLVAGEAEALIRASTPARVLLEDDLDELAARAASVPPLAPPAAPDPRTPLAILHTSGTTGRPKGAILTRAAFVASSRAAWQVLGARADDAWLLAMPLCHVGGLSIVTRCLAARAAVVLKEWFDADVAGATIVSVVPTMLARLLEQGDLAAARAVLVGGAACPPALLEACAARGVQALTTYGLTEACAMVTLQRKVGEPGCGTPLPGTEVKIQDGRIHVRGPTVFSGYLGHRPHEPGAWLDTGDLGELDAEGRLHVHARRVDLVVTGGENVYPAEVEAAIETCDGVRRALVFGVPDAEWGEIVACALEMEREVPEPALFTSITRVLATHKRPRRVCFVDALPTIGEKLDRARAKRELTPLARPWKRN